MILDTDQCSLFTPSGNEQYVEALYEAYLKNPDSLATEWRQYFDSLATRFKRSTPDIPHEPIQRHFLALARHPKMRFTEETTTATLKQERATEFITAFRRLGHLEATTDP